MNWHFLFTMGLDAVLIGIIVMNMMINRNNHKRSRGLETQWQAIRDHQEMLKLQEQHLAKIDANLRERAECLRQLDHNIAAQARLNTSEGMNDMIMSIMEIKETKH